METTGFRYGIALAAVAVATLLRWSMDGIWGSASPYIFFYAAIMLAVVFGGRGPAILATILGGAIGIIFFVAPRGLFWVETPAELIRLATFTGIGIFMARLGGGLRISRRYRQAQEALRQSEERFRTLDRASFEGIAITQAGRFMDVNDQFASMLGYPPGELIGMAVSDILAPEDRDRIAAAIRSGRDADSEHAAVRKDGSRIIVEAHGRMISYKGRDVRITVIRDITPQKQAEQALLAAMRSAEQARAEAEAANAAKDQFLAILSHELRTPLTPVIMTASMLSHRRDLPEDVRADLQTIQRNVQLEARLIDDLLDLTRIARGKMQFDFQPVDVHLVIRAAADVCSQGDGAPIALDLQAQDHWVRADAARLQQVFWNLLNNARKFTPTAGAIRIRSANTPSGQLHVEVVDTGAGIDPALLPRLFNAFQQGDAGGRRQGGLGLGLTISKAIMDAHGGTISARSDGPGLGSTFSIDIAIVPPLPHELEVRGSLHRAPHPHPDQPLRILLVEDHDSTRAILGRLIAAFGHSVGAAPSIQAAKDMADREPFNLVISDLGLPDGSGHDLMRWLRDHHGLRGIALSGYGMEEDIRRSMESGFVEHLIKPINVEQLQAAIDRVMSAQPV